VLGVAAEANPRQLPTPNAQLPTPAMDILGIGTDITECLRIAQMIERHGELFVDRVYTREEIRYCQQRKQATQHYTGRWAAKEAVLKALGTGWRRGISWRDVEVLNEPGGQPIVILRGGAAEAAGKLGITEMRISISHCRSHATATAIALGKEKKDKDEG
jgi:holo-[acyl-carrier protein] synthase